MNRLSPLALPLLGSLRLLPRGAVVVAGAVTVASLISQSPVWLSVQLKVGGCGEYNGGLTGPRSGSRSRRAIAATEIGQRYHDAVR
jgi:hypothetical protein